MIFPGTSAERREGKKEAFMAENKKFVITVGRQYGSGGAEMAKRLGERLGLHVYDKEILKMTSEESGIRESYFHLADEKAGNKLLYRIIHSLIPENGTPSLGSDLISSDNLFRFQSSVIRKLAQEESCIIIGRCADYVLDGTENLVRLFVYADFRLKDILLIVTNKGFWLIALLCVLFYSAVFPFLKYATDLMVNKYNVDPELAGNIPAILPFGTILLTPFFGNLYDRKGKGATIMIFGALMLIGVHLLFTLPILNQWWFATIVMIVLGIAFSLVPSAMWPSVPKIIPEKQLGTAYALIFWVQNIGLSMVPLLIGWILDTYCKIDNGTGKPAYDYTIPMAVFTCFGVLALFIALMLKREDRIKGYGLELPNIQKDADKAEAEIIAKEMIAEP